MSKLFTTVTALPERSSHYSNGSMMIVTITRTPVIVAAVFPMVISVPRTIARMMVHMIVMPFSPVAVINHAPGH